MIRFLASRLGQGSGADGVLTHGGSIGSLTALFAARQAKAGFDAWTEGSAGGPPLAVLGSAQAHYCVARAAQLMGWGKAGFASVPVDDRFRLRPEALDAAFTRAVDAGRKPIVVAASACSTATGSFDPLPEIASFCEERGIWLHVDGAHGASAALSDKTRRQVRRAPRARARLRGRDPSAVQHRLLPSPPRGRDGSRRAPGDAAPRPGRGRLVLPRPDAAPRRNFSADHDHQPAHQRRRSRRAGVPTARGRAEALKLGGGERGGREKAKSGPDRGPNFRASGRPWARRRPSKRSRSCGDRRRDRRTSSAAPASDWWDPRGYRGGSSGACRRGC